MVWLVPQQIVGVGFGYNTKLVEEFYMNDNMNTPVTGSEEEVMEPTTVNPDGEEMKPVEEGADADAATVAPEGETQNEDPTV